MLFLCWWISATIISMMRSSISFLSNKFLRNLRCFSLLAQTHQLTSPKWLYTIFSRILRLRKRLGNKFRNILVRVPMTTKPWKNSNISKEFKKKLHDFTALETLPDQEEWRRTISCRIFPSVKAQLSKPIQLEPTTVTSFLINQNSSILNVG